MSAQESSPTLSVIEAARYLGIHRNTVLARIHKGALFAHSVMQPDGRHIYRIPVDVLPKDAHERPDFRAHKGTGRTTEGAQHEIAPIVPVEQLQAVLAPFLAEIGHVRQELGKVTAERDAALARVQALEAERSNSVGAPRHYPDHERSDQTVAPRSDSDHETPRPLSWWARLRGSVRGTKN